MNFIEEIPKVQLELDEVNEKKDSPSVSLVEQAVKMRQELTQTYFGIKELLRLYINTSVVEYFIKDNSNQCDTGSIQKSLKKVPHKKSKL